MNITIDDKATPTIAIITIFILIFYFSGFILREVLP